MRVGDLTGRQFSHWKVLGLGEKSNTGKKRWLCKCVCGRERNVFQNVLLNGKSNSCGCRNGEDLTNQQFGFLTAVAPVIRGDGVRVWLCKCVCGNEPLIRPNSLKMKHTTSCGCEGLKRRKESLKKFRKEPGESRIGGNYHSYKCSAKKHGYEFLITKEEFKTLSLANCHYCGSPPHRVPHASNKNIATNGLDRVNTSKGYTIDNVVTCCFTCHRAKSTLTLGEFKAWIVALIYYNTKNRAEVPPVP